jgi:hypothetical protein
MVHLEDKMVNIGYSFIIFVRRSVISVPNQKLLLALSVGTVYGSTNPEYSTEQWIRIWIMFHTLRLQKISDRKNRQHFIECRCKWI